MNPSVVVAVGSSLIAFGAGWQTVTYAFAAVSEMDSFLSAKNKILAEERERIRAAINRWRVLKRRAELKKVVAQVDGLLFTGERELEKAYDKTTVGWSFVLVG